ncbi:hypothetical protein BGZ60DRAFT_466569 [Tricladium varicosporioides]|nr:hypothetical protein BGZ60DRAFT_466569 [Hymenoscyphus varicosporioides]
MSQDKNRYWIPNLDISKKVIMQDIQYYLGPDATVRAYTHQEQIDDICRKSKEVWEKQAAARSNKESDRQLKRPLHQPVLVSRGSRSDYSSRPRRHSDEREKVRGDHKG